MSLTNKSNEEIRIVAFGQIAEYFEKSELPKALPKEDNLKKVARIGLGVHHAVFLFYSYQVASVGKNDRGQLGFPISDIDSENIYKDLQILDIQKFKDEGKRIIDIAAGAYHTMLLAEPIDHEESKEKETREVYVMGDRNMLGRFETKDSSEPILITIPRLEQDPSLRIKYIYSRNEKCVVMDTDHGMTLWGRDFNGFFQREPSLFCQFKYSVKIALGPKHGLATDENKKLYVWGDGTYGELGRDTETEEVTVETPTKHAYFDNKDIKVHSISIGNRHSVVVDTEGKMYSFGDNSKGQLATYEERQDTPNMIDTGFEAMAVFSGHCHNLVKTKDGRIFTWGGDSKLQTTGNKNGTFLKYMYEFKGKKTSNIQTAHDNTIVISHLKVYKEPKE